MSYNTNNIQNLPSTNINEFQQQCEQRWVTFAKGKLFTLCYDERHIVGAKDADDLSYMIHKLKHCYDIVELSILLVSSYRFLCVPMVTRTSYWITQH